MVWIRDRHERQQEVGGTLTLACRWQLDVPLGSCREEPDLFAEIQVRLPRVYSGGTQTILLRRASSIGATAATDKTVALSTSLASPRSLVPGDMHALQVRAVNIGGRTCPGPCHFASAATPRPRDPP